MADQVQPSAITFDPAKLESLEELLQDLKDRARKANDAGDLIMLAVYNDLVQVASKIVTRAYTRLEREQNAHLNKAEKALRKQQKAERDAAREQAKAQNAAASA